MNRFDDIEPRLHDLIDGRLDPLEERELRNLLARDADLDRRFRELQWLVGNLSVLRDDRAPAQFAGRVLAAIERDEAAPVRGHLRRLPRWLGSLAAVVLFSVLAGLWVATLARRDGSYESALSDRAPGGTPAPTAAPESAAPSAERVDGGLLSDRSPGATDKEDGPAGADRDARLLDELLRTSRQRQLEIPAGDAGFADKRPAEELAAGEIVKGSEPEPTSPPATATLAPEGGVWSGALSQELDALAPGPPAARSTRPADVAKQASGPTDASKAKAPAVPAAAGGKREQAAPTLDTLVLRVRYPSTGDALRRFELADASGAELAANEVGRASSSTETELPPALAELRERHRGRAHLLERDRAGLEQLLDGLREEGATVRVLTATTVEEKDAVPARLAWIDLDPTTLGPLLATARLDQAVGAPDAQAARTKMAPTPGYRVLIFVEEP